jgi:MHS family proline/betaine transporter-like MFS transporter
MGSHVQGASAKKIISASIIGNAMEWYDYLLYAHFSLIIGKLFFPMENTFYSTMITLGVFAAGFLARPLGGYVFGLIGDRLGRRSALMASILLMAVPTAAIGVLPTYEQIGLWAPCAMLLIRVLQGISLGGEYSSSTTYLVESAPEHRKAFFGSFSSFSLALGVLWSTLTVLFIESVYSKQEILDFAWRIPFLLSAIYGLVGFYTRQSLDESEEFKQASKGKTPCKTPFKEIFAHHRSSLIAAMGIFMGLTIPFYVLVVFSKHVLMDMGFVAHTATLLNAWLVFVYMCTTPFSGYLTDRVGESKVLFWSAVGMAIFIYPFFLIIETSNLPMIIIAFFIAGLLIGLFQGAVPIFSARAFPISVRASGVSLGYNIPAILFGGTAPMLVTALMKAFNGAVLPVALYVIFGSLCAASIAWRSFYLSSLSSEQS